MIVLSKTTLSAATASERLVTGNGPLAFCSPPLPLPARSLDSIYRAHCWIWPAAALPDPGAANVSFSEADVQTYSFAPATFDAVFSRFGIMFFADPSAAFANIRRALKPGGRMAFVCWRTPAENIFMTLPYTAAAAQLPPAPPSDPDAPGPFAFAEPARVRHILSSAGFRDIALAQHDRKIGSGNLEQTLAMSLQIGLLGRALREHPEKRALVIDDVLEALRPHVDVDGVVRLGSASWIVTARA